jgi:apolipoprotein N-acyltransferase
MLLCRLIFYFLAGTLASALAVACTGLPSLFAAFLAAIFLWGVARASSVSSPARFVVLLMFGSASWLTSSWWLATGVHSMNQSYWWTGYVVASVAALWGGVPYMVLALLPSKREVQGSLRTTLGAAALFSVVTDCWPHPFAGNVAVGLTSAPAAIQIAEIGGVPLLLCILHVVGFLFAEGILQRGASRLRFWCWATTLLLLWIGAGWFRFEQVRRRDSGAPHLVVGVVQPNIPIEGVPSLGIEGSMEELATRTRTLLLSTKSRADVVIWPEIPKYFSPKNNPNDRSFIHSIVEGSSAPLLLNADMFTNETVYGRVPRRGTYGVPKAPSHSDWRVPSV